MLESVWERLRRLAVSDGAYFVLDQHMVCSWCGACIYCSILYCACNRQRPVIAMQNEAVFWNPLPGLWWNKSNMVSVTWKSTAGSILQCICGIWCSMVSIVFYQSDCAACGGSF